VAELFDPYAPPTAELEARHELGAVARKGKLVRMDREGRLPQRCVGCNAPAVAQRVSRTLYWSPWRWRLFMFGTPILLIALAFTGVEPAGFIAFMLVPVLVIANMIIRKKHELDIALCERHQRIRVGLRWASLCATLLLFVVPFASLRSPFLISTYLLAVVVLMLVLGTAYARSAAQRVAISEMTPRHVLLKRTGAAFRDSLPEAGAD
jgi:hypothetical protein